MSDDLAVLCFLVCERFDALEQGVAGDGGIGGDLRVGIDGDDCIVLFEGLGPLALGLDFDGFSQGLTRCLFLFAVRVGFVSCRA